MIQNVAIIINKQAIKKNKKNQKITIYLKRINILEGLQARQNELILPHWFSISIISL